MSNQIKFDYVFKILLMGDHISEKSSVFLRFIEDLLYNNFVPSIGIELVSIIIYINYIYIKIKGNKTNGCQKQISKTSDMGYSRA